MAASPAPAGRQAHMHAIRYAALIALAVAVSPTTMQAAIPHSTAVIAHPLQAPETRSEGREAQDAAVAAAVIGLVSGQFGERAVQVKLDRVDTVRNSLLQVDVSGDGRLLIGDDDEWLPFRFACLYDTVANTASAPRLVIGGDEPGQAMPVQSGMAVSLRNEVETRLRDEFRQQVVSLTLDRVDSLDTGKRYARIEAAGTADFGRDGSTPTGIEAIYDRRAAAWVQVRYELGSTANRGDAIGG